MKHTLAAWTGIVITGAFAGEAAHDLGVSAARSVTFGICAGFIAAGLALIAIAIATATWDGKR